MIILSIDSTTPIAGLAVVQDQKLMGEYMVNTKNTHSEKLMPMIAALLGELSLTPEDLDAVAVMQGPGSFTGLRIGMATAKGIAQGCGKKLIAVPTLDCLAYNLVEYPGVICPVMNAQKKEVYTALYQTVNGCWERLSDYQAIAAIQLAEHLNSLQKDVWFLGDGVSAYEDTFRTVLGERCHIAALHQILPRAASLAALAMQRANTAQFDDLYTAELIYIRKSEAEVQWEAKHQKN